MKYVKTSNWIRLRGQEGPNKEICKIDTAVTEKERVFFVPETEEEKAFFNMDTLLGFTKVPYGPTSHNPDEPWGWRFFANRTEEDMQKFAEGVNATMKNIYEYGLLESTGKKPVLN